METHTIIGLGEILWDMLPGGKQLGGAPANFACHAGSLGARGVVISAIGDDDLGREILDTLDAMGLSGRTVAVNPERPTGTVSVHLDADGKPSYTIERDVAWDYIPADELLLSTAAEASAICFGSLAQRGDVSRDSIRTMLKTAPKDSLRIFDVNLRGDFYGPEVIDESLQLASVLKVSDEELPLIASMLSIEGDTGRIVRQLADRYFLDLVALTRGPAGSLLLAGGLTSDRPAHETRVADTVGAGDAFTAAMALGMLAGHDLDRINAQAGRVASYVCSQKGATPPLPEELTRFFA